MSLSQQSLEWPTGERCCEESVVYWLQLIDQESFNGSEQIDCVVSGCSLHARRRGVRELEKVEESEEKGGKGGGGRLWKRKPPLDLSPSGRRGGVQIRLSQRMIDCRAACR